MSRGGFIEDKLGQQQGMDLRELGWSSHARYGTCRGGSQALRPLMKRYLLDDGCPAPARMVGHLDGKRYLRQAKGEGVFLFKEQLRGAWQEAKAALEERERAKVRDEDPPAEAQ